MEYQEAEAYLLEIPRFAGKNEPEATRAFLEHLGEPCRDKVLIHIAGTNGKGSVCAYLSSVLQCAGYRVGMFTSPHLVTMRERFRVNGEMAGEAEFVRCFQKVRAELPFFLPDGRRYQPTFFEMLFFMAMLYFEEQDTEVVLLETGLGGRLDATNSVSRKDLCIITQIGLDHMEYLGDSIGKIAGEKAGILREGVPLVFADRQNEASQVILEEALRLSCPVFPVSKADVQKSEFHKNFIAFSYNTRYYGYVRCSLATCARYQIENAALALRALDALAGRLPVTKEALVSGMRRAKWEGRMEEILPGVFLDGAHNVDGVRAFLDTVERDGCRGRRFLLFSAAADKQYAEMAELLSEGKRFDEIVLIRIKNKRGVARQALEESFRRAGAKALTVLSDSETALEALLQKKGPEDRIYIAGSLYLAGEIKAYIGREETCVLIGGE